MKFAAFMTAVFASTLVAGRAFEKRAAPNLHVYATFYDDDACKQNGGIAVSTANPGCLNESGRHSIYFQSGTESGKSLVVSTKADYNCQKTCIGGIATGKAYCYNLNTFPNAANAPSYRFVSNTCDNNNC